MQAAEHSMKKVQLRMAEAEKKMLQDDVISDDMLMVATSRSDLLKQTESKCAHCAWLSTRVQLSTTSIALKCRHLFGLQAVLFLAISFYGTIPFQVILT